MRRCTRNIRGENMKNGQLCLAFLCIAISFCAQAENNLDGWGFGIGIGFELYNNPYIKTASMNGAEKIVSVNEEYKSIPALWSAVNWTVTAQCKHVHIPARWVCTEWVKPGWFVGAKLIGQNGAGLDGAAVGIQWAFLRPADGGGAGKRKSLNLGVGIGVTKFRELASGIKEGQALPSYYDDVRYRDTTKPMFLILVTKDIAM